MTKEEYSAFLLPNVEHDWKYYEEKYPKRDLNENQMVTRFAPSPTGFVHMGSLYASFMDLQFAKQTNGICILRIEDTDGKRTIENGIQGIIDDFKNLRPALFPAFAAVFNFRHEVRINTVYRDKIRFS